MFNPVSAEFHYALTYTDSTESGGYQFTLKIPRKF